MLKMQTIGLLLLAKGLINNKAVFLCGWVCIYSHIISKYVVYFSCLVMLFTCFLGHAKRALSVICPSEHYMTVFSVSMRP